MQPSAAHRRPPPETDSDKDMSFFRIKDREQGEGPAPAATSALQGKPLIEHVIRYLQSVVGPGLVCRKEPYLQDGELKKLGIQVTGLDLTSGEAQPPVLFNDRFLKPIGPSDIETWLKRNRPKEYHDWLADNGETWNDTRFNEARSIINFLDTLLIEKQ